MPQKTAVITGITGQDGAYLARFLVDKGYTVHGLVRRSSQTNLERLEYIFADSASNEIPVYLHYGDLTDTPNLINLLKKTQPNEIYNLAAQSHVGISFTSPVYTANCNATGVLGLLEAVHTLGLHKDVRLYQASTSELYGLVQETPQTESTPFYPRSPYAVSKLFAYWMVINYRESYNLYAANGILFNHESPIRGKEFVTRKITYQLAKIVHNKQDQLRLGNLNALRDWGHTLDFIKMQWLILQQNKPDDYVIATGKQHSVRNCVNISAELLGIKLEWQGTGQNEVGIISSFHKGIASDLSHLKIGQKIIVVDPAFYRPTEVETLLGNPQKASTQLGWKPQITFENLIQEMVETDYKRLSKEGLNPYTKKPTFHFA